MNVLLSPEAWLGLLTLTVLEIVLGIDNIIFISILAGKLPAQEQGRARLDHPADRDAVHAARSSILGP